MMFAVTACSITQWVISAPHRAQVTTSVPDPSGQWASRKDLESPKTIEWELRHWEHFEAIYRDYALDSIVSRRDRSRPSR